MISIRRKIDEHDHFALSFQALVKAFQGVANALPKAALPASPDVHEQCKTSLRQAVARLEDAPSRSDIDEAGAATLTQLDEICRANQSAMEERDAILKEVVTTVAGAISGFKGHGARHESSLTKVADGFESLARIGDVHELRRQLQQNVAQLRQSVEEMRRESDGTVRRFESQLHNFEQRLESARKGSSTDRLTGLGSRREAERQIRKIPQIKKPVCVLLFDIEGFGEINSRYGTIFGDKLLQVLAHTLKSRFPDEGSLFRWGSDEFLVIAEGTLAMRTDQCRALCQNFASAGYTTYEGSARKQINARLAAGVLQYQEGDNPEDLYHRCRETLEHNRASLTR